MCMACDPLCPNCHYKTWRPSEEDKTYRWLAIMCKECREECDGQVPDDERLNNQGMWDAWREWSKENKGADSNYVYGL